MRTGSWIQQWTTLRNVAEALAVAGDHRTPITLVTAAAHDPAASALSADASKRIDEIMAGCEERLTRQQISEITASAAAATGPEIVTLALTAIDNALADHGTDLETLAHPAQRASHPPKDRPPATGSRSTNVGSTPP